MKPIQLIVLIAGVLGASAGWLGRHVDARAKRVCVPLAPSRDTARDEAKLDATELCASDESSRADPERRDVAVDVTRVGSEQSDAGPVRAATFVVIGRDDAPPLNGHVRCVDASGRLDSEGAYANGAKSGAWVYYSDAGHVELQGVYVNGLACGVWRSWYRSGVAAAESSCRDGKWDGYCRFWNGDGTLDADRSGLYAQGQKIR